MLPSFIIKGHDSIIELNDPFVIRIDWYEICQFDRKCGVIELLLEDNNVLLFLVVSSIFY